MTITKIPPVSGLVDAQFIQIEGPDNLTTSYQYDQQQRALYFKESQIVYPSHHGSTHIAEDPIPTATCDSIGLMAADDKCKLDALLQMRVGVLGFMGAGMVDDGGWLNGDIILAAGTDFISLERVGNIVRFSVDIPSPLSCSCESCQTIFFVQDESSISDIRPPTCSGKFPGINNYGEMKVYLFPESTIVDPNNPIVTLNKKGNYPTLIFKRYTNGLVPNTAEFDVVLKRDVNGGAEVGWVMTPGPATVPECAWFMGKDDDGNQIRFDLHAETEPGLLGALLYKGHLLTKKMGVVTGYASSVLTTNQYTCKNWDVDNGKAIGDAFTAKNVWLYSNPENSLSGSNPRTLVTDKTIDLLPVGTLVDIWYFQTGIVGNDPILRYYFNKRPHLNPNFLWAWGGGVQFGDVIVARTELIADSGSDDKVSSEQVSTIRNFERNLWGLTGYNDPLFDFDIVNVDGTAGADISQEHRAVIDTALPGLKVVPSTTSDVNFSERPVVLWNRKEYTNTLIRVDLGRPSLNDFGPLFTPLDIIIRGNIDEYTEKYMKVSGSGTVNGLPYVRVKGVAFHDLPPFGAVRVLHPSGNHNYVYNYTRKCITPTALGSEGADAFDSIVLLGDGAYGGSTGDIVELLHQEYDTTVVRLEFSFDSGTGLAEVQFKVGQLDMSVAYDEDVASDLDDFVRGLAPGFAVSAVYSQAGTFTGVGSKPTTAPDSFVMYDGGTQIGGTLSEYWNKLEVMVRDNQVWVWWNELIIPPNTTLSANLDTPVDISTPYFPIDIDVNKPYGKVGARLWPGCSLRRMDVRSQATLDSEYSRGGLEIS